MPSPTDHVLDTSWVELMARVGHAAKGAVYVVIGVLAVQFSAGSGGDTAGARGAVRTIANQPFGMILLWTTAIGLAAFAAWRFVQAVADAEQAGSDFKGKLKRGGFFVSGLLHTSLAAFAVQLATGFGAPNSDSRSPQQLTQSVLSQPFGQWLVLAVGFAVLVAACFQFYRAYSAKFMEKLGSLSSTERKWSRRAGMLGFSARGVVFLIIGWFFIQAAIQADAGQVRGLDGALDALASESHGPWVLGIVAAGLLLYGVFMMITARHLRVQT